MPIPRRDGGGHRGRGRRPPPRARSCSSPSSRPRRSEPGRGTEGVNPACGHSRRSSPSTRRAARRRSRLSSTARAASSSAASSSPDTRGQPRLPPPATARPRCALASPRRRRPLLRVCGQGYQQRGQRRRRGRRSASRPVTRSAARRFAARRPPRRPVIGRLPSPGAGSAGNTRQHRRNGVTHTSAAARRRLSCLRAWARSCATMALSEALSGHPRARSR